MTARTHDLARDFNPFVATGVVAAVTSAGVAIEDRLGLLALGARIEIETTKGLLVGEVIGVEAGHALALPFQAVDGVRRGARVNFCPAQQKVSPSPAWLGRIVNAFGDPVDGLGPLPRGAASFPTRARPPRAAQRARLGAPLDFGVAAMNAFTPARAGQRLGVFAAAGLGKSSLLSMIARNTECDIAVIALIGERGREVREFVEDHLGAERLARSVVVVATSDESALMRREAAFLAMTLCEYFRDYAVQGAGPHIEGPHVLCLMDSLTRVAAAQREIGLAAGEPAAARGYPPSVFSLLPQILERAGPGRDTPKGARSGAVSGVFSVLVDGDDHDEPVADACRALLDGHVVLDRRVAESGRFPAINILKSVSRLSASQIDPRFAELATTARRHESLYEDMREMIRIGAYQPGTNAETDDAIAFHGRLEEFLTQSRDHRVSMESTGAALEKILQAAPVEETVSL
ncbi:MAG: FliI/YscN family ATPase [Pseudomonadota bacterium]